MTPRLFALLLISLTSACGVLDEAPLYENQDDSEEAPVGMEMPETPEIALPGPIDVPHRTPRDPLTAQATELSPTPRAVAPGCEGVGPSEDDYDWLQPGNGARVYGTICHESVGHWVTYKLGAASVLAVTEDPRDVSLEGFVRGEDGVLRACSDAGVEPTVPFHTGRDFEPIYLCHTEADEQLVYVHVTGATGTSFLTVVEVAAYAHFEHDCRTRYDDRPSGGHTRFGSHHQNFLCAREDEDWYRFYIKDSAGRVVTLTPGDAAQALEVEVCRGVGDACLEVATDASGAPLVLRTQAGAPATWTIPSVAPGDSLYWMLRVRGDVSAKPYILTLD